MTLPYHHPIIGKDILLPNMTFVARWPKGKYGRYRYSGSQGESLDGTRWVNCVDRRGNARSIPVDAITRIIRNREGTR